MCLRRMLCVAWAQTKGLRRSPTDTNKIWQDLTRSDRSNEALSISKLQKAWAVYGMAFWAGGQTLNMSCGAPLVCATFAFFVGGGTASKQCQGKLSNWLNETNCTKRTVRNGAMVLDVKLDNSKERATRNSEVNRHGRYWQIQKRMASTCVGASGRKFTCRAASNSSDQKETALAAHWDARPIEVMESTAAETLWN